MRVWIVSVGEPLPTDGENVRLRRMGTLAGLMAKQGHDVSWFSASFDHYNKIQRCTEKKDIVISDNYVMHILYTKGYRRNISPQRILHHRMAAKLIYAKMDEYEPPDIIIASMEPLEVSSAAVRYGKKKNVPVVVDVRDLWPDIYREVVPKLCRPLIAPYVWMCRTRLRKTMASAFSIIGLSDGYLKYGLHYADRKKNNLDSVIPIAYPNYDYSSYRGELAPFWKKLGVSRDDFLVVFVGSFSRQFIFNNIIEAARILKRHNKVKFIMCGTGEQENLLRVRAPDNVIFSGWIEKEQILSLTANASVGIAPYVDSMNYRYNTPNKFGEYLSAGLPVLTSAHGDMEDLLKDHECGYHYDDGKALAKRIEDYYLNEQKLLKHKENARRLFELRFNGDVIYPQMMTHLEDVGSVYKQEKTKRTISVCGHFGGSTLPADGQTVKTRSLTKELRSMLGEANVRTVDTHGWKKRIIPLIAQCISSVIRSDKIIMLPAHNGVCVIPRFFMFINTLFKRQLYYVVIGGWLPNMLKKNSRLRRRLIKLDGIFVETRSMKNDLLAQGLSNVHILVNFKRLPILTEEELTSSQQEPLRLCFFARVTKDKGIEDAIQAVMIVNRALVRSACVLDIYGPVSDDYREEFETVLNTSPHARYCGEVDPKDAVRIIRNYFMLLFPTRRYYSEGIPGTIIDAYHAGVPVLAARWRSFADILDDGITGIGYELGNLSAFVGALRNCVQEPDKVNAMKQSCLKKALDFAPQKVMSEFLEKL